MRVQMQKQIRAKQAPVPVLMNGTGLLLHRFPDSCVSPHVGHLSLTELLRSFSTYLLLSEQQLGTERYGFLGFQLTRDHGYPGLVGTEDPY